MRSLWLMMIALLLVGCGGSGPARPALNPVKGKVTFPFTGLSAGLAGPEPPQPIIIKIIINQRLLILTS